ncbi:MAG: hypothetical protein FJZ57_03400 [Chlamydiae bacterium]|nr:hypothetical protein [Chlamydiota bacterium]
MSAPSISASEACIFYYFSDKPEFSDINARCRSVYNEATSKLEGITTVDMKCRCLNKIKNEYEKEISKAVDLYALSLRIFKQKHPGCIERILTPIKMAGNAVRSCKTRISHLKISSIIDRMKESLDPAEFTELYTTCILELQIKAKEYVIYGRSEISAIENDFLSKEIELFKDCLHKCRLFSRETLEETLPVFDPHRYVNLKILNTKLDNFLTLLNEENFHQKLSRCIRAKLEQKVLKYIELTKAAETDEDQAMNICKTLLALSKIASFVGKTEAPTIVQSTHFNELRDFLIKFSIKTKNIKICDTPLIVFINQFIEDPEHLRANEENHANDLSVLYNHYSVKICNNLHCFKTALDYIKGSS